MSAGCMLLSANPVLAHVGNMGVENHCRIGIMQCHGWCPPHKQKNKILQILDRAGTASGKESLLWLR